VLDAPNRINLIHIHRTNLRVESRESRERWKHGKRERGRVEMAGLWRGGRDEGRANICPSASWILAPLPSHYSLHSDWITYNQHQTFLNSISCTRAIVYFPAFSALWNRFEKYEGSIPRGARETGLFSYYAQMYTSEHVGNRYIVIAFSLFPSLFLSLSL